GLRLLEGGAGGDVGVGGQQVQRGLQLVELGGHRGGGAADLPAQRLHVGIDGGRFGLHLALHLGGAVEHRDDGVGQLLGAARHLGGPVIEVQRTAGQRAQPAVQGARALLQLAELPVQGGGAGGQLVGGLVGGL